MEQTKGNSTISPGVIAFPAFVSYDAFTKDDTRVEAEVIADMMVK